MDEKRRKKIFEPFFTTKEVGEGTGLGLATVYGIVQQNGSTIDVESEFGKGTEFRILLPAHGDHREVDKHDQPAILDENRGTETILLVEHETAILGLGSKLLGRHGYTVLAAHSPEEAIERARKHREKIHLLVTDVVMPNLKGREPAERLSSWYPSIKCLFMAGYTEELIADHGVLEPGINFVEKPFPASTLSEQVRKALDSPVTAAGMLGLDGSDGYPAG